jgi:OmpA-OmpF porin, OOP family
VIELTAGALEHMVKGMGGSLAMPREQLDALLATNGNRIGLTMADMKQLMKEAGPNGISLAQIEAMMPRSEGERLKANAPAGRPDKDCPGLVYGTGKRAICLPLGQLSFADVAVSFKPGAKPSRTPFDFPGSALGEPDYRSTTSADFISLGCNGELVAQFTDNVLVDVEGVDLYIFEIGPIVERTELAISVDGRDWVEVGVIEGARSDVDIRPFAKKGERYGFVRLRNAGKACGGNHAGADIDAIAAVGAEIRLSLDSALLFDVGKSVLKPEALAALDTLAQQVQAYGEDIRVTVEGHTDSTGADAANLALSEARAKSVWTYLGQRVALPANRVNLKGYGETRPVATNDTEEGRAKNRRVDLLIAPAGTRR